MFRLVRRYAAILAGVCLTALLYQNCGRGFSADSGDFSSNGGLGTTTPGATDPGFFAFPFSYSGASSQIVIGETISFKPQFSSADVFAYSFSVAPTLPSGMSLNPTTGEIVGTPYSLSPSTTYVVTAKNNKGVATATLPLAVIETVPKISYSSAAVSFYTNTNAVSFRPVLAGTKTATYSISPILPAGLGISATTGEITGRPAQAMTEQTYVVSAENAQGKSSYNLKISIVDPPTGAFYTYARSVYRVGTPITTNEVIRPSGCVFIRNYEISPRLPAGLSQDFNGSITGTPAEVSNETNYAVKLECSDGPIYNVVVNLTVGNTAPKLSLPSVENVQLPLGAFASFAVKNSAGKATSYSLSPAQLPEGLSFSSTTGVISGLPKALSEPASYTITANNEVGSSAVKFNLKIGPKAPNPKYPFVKFALNVGSAMDAVLPYVDGDSGDVNWYVTDVALPEGVSIDNRTGRLSGVATAEVINKKIRIIGSGSGGYKVFNVSFSARANMPLIKSLMMSSCSTSYLAACLYNTDRGPFGATTYLDGATLENINIQGLDGDAVMDVSAGSAKYVLSSEGSLYVSDSSYKVYALVPGYSKNVKGIRLCDSYYVCVLLTSGVAQVVTGTVQGANIPAQVSVVAAFNDLPQNAVEMGTALSGSMCYVLSTGGMKCKNGMNSYSTTQTPAYDVASVTGAVKVYSVLGNLCYVTTDGSLYCFSGTLPATASVATKVPGLPAIKKVVSYYGYACGLTTTNGVKCWGRDRLASANDSIPLPCSGATCLPAVTSPIDIAGLTSGVTDIAFTDLKACGLLEDGSVKCASFDPAVPSDKRYAVAAADVQGLQYGVKTLTGNVSCLYGITAVGGLKARCGTGDIFTINTSLGIYIAR